MPLRLLDLLLPRRCLRCGLPGADVCPPCIEALPRLSGTSCARCGAPTAWPVARCRECAGRRLAFATARAAVAYDAVVRSIVTGWKERGLRHIASVAAAVVGEVVPRPGAAVLTFVPPDPDRVGLRGHHPPGRLAEELAVRWEIHVERLLRRRPAPRQRGLDVAARRRNVAGLFTPVGRAPPRVVLVDDVYTSGATAAAAASALRRAGARRVDVVTFARAIRSLDSWQVIRAREASCDSR